MMYRLLLSCMLLSISLHSYSQKLLKDIASSDASSNINQSFADFKNNLIKGDTLFFLAQDTITDNFYYKNIWFSNGTAANTKKVTKGVGPYYQNSPYEFLASFKGKTYYRYISDANLYATDGNAITVVKTFTNSSVVKASVIDGWLYVYVSNTAANILELWKTDGTTVNTSKVTDIYNGSHAFNGTNFFNAGDKMYFSVYTSTTGYEPWITDGTASGTKILKDLQPGSASGNPVMFEKVGNTIFFCAYNSNQLLKLWKTDGTEPGTVLVADAINGDLYYYPRVIINYAGQLYLVTNNGKLYKTDGNTITLVRSDLNILGEIVKMNNLMYFISLNGSEYELWKSDGSTVGTQKIKSILNTPYTNSMYIRVLAGTSKVYFELSASGNGGLANITQHWVSDGTTDGTININTLNPNFSTGAFTNQLAVVGDTYYFTAYDATNGFELWKSNGTPAGTMMVNNINTTIASSNPMQFAALGNDVFFTANDVKNGREIWKTDGSAQNTNLFVDYNASGFSDINYSADITGMIAFNDVIIAQVMGYLVKFNQNTPPTVFYSMNLINPKNPEFIRFKNKVYYKGYDYYNGGGYKLFATDGTTSYRVKDMSGASYLGADPSNFLIWNDLLYFMTENNTKIWKSDGTEAGTVLVKDLTGGTIQTKFYAANGLLMFVYTNPTFGEELWKTDGTSAGTALVKDIYPGTGGAFISNLVVYDNNLFFTAFENSALHIYKSDGSSANTQIFSNLVGPFGSQVFKNKLFFIAFEYSSSAYWLYSTDGNSAPLKIQQLSATIREPNAILMKNINNNLLVFDITPTTARHELWASDGTTAGTKLAKVIREVELNTSYMNITEYVYNNNKLYFAADDGIHGKELWVWDFDCPEFLTITNPVSQDTDVVVEKYIIGSNKINSGKKVSYNASKYISLNPGFETQSGAQFATSMNGCINLAATSGSTTGNGPIFQHSPIKERYKPNIFQFLNDPLNAKLLSAYIVEKNNNNEQNIAWIIDESSDKYILKMLLHEKEFIGYLPK